MDGEKWVNINHLWRDFEPGPKTRRFDPLYIYGEEIEGEGREGPQRGPSFQVFMRGPRGSDTL